MAALPACSPQIHLSESIFVTYTIQVKLTMTKCSASAVRSETCSRQKVNFVPPENYVVSTSFQLAPHQPFRRVTAAALSLLPRSTAPDWGSSEVLLTPRQPPHSQRAGRCTQFRTVRCAGSPQVTCIACSRQAPAARSWAPCTSTQPPTSLPCLSCREWARSACFRRGALPSLQWRASAAPTSSFEKNWN